MEMIRKGKFSSKSFLSFVFTEGFRTTALQSSSITVRRTRAEAVFFAWIPRRPSFRAKFSPNNRRCAQRSVTPTRSRKGTFQVQIGGRRRRWTRSVFATRTGAREPVNQRLVSKRSLPRLILIGPTHCRT